MTLLIATRNAHKIKEIQAVLGTQFAYLSLRDYPEAPSVVEDADTMAGNATKKSTELAAWLQAEMTKGQGTQTLDPLFAVIADDSGLEVDALNGAPGVHSARFAAVDEKITPTSNSPDAANNAKLLRLLHDIPAEHRTARFRCVIAFTELQPPHRQGREAGTDPTLVGTPGMESRRLGTASHLRPAARFMGSIPNMGATQLFEGVCEGRIGFEPRGAAGFGYDPLFFPNGFSQTFAELGEDVKNQLSHRAQALAKLKQFLAKTDPRSTEPV